MTRITSLLRPLTGFVILDVFHNSQVTDYELSVSEVPDDHGGTVATATSLDFESPIQGAIQVAGDEDWFRFETSANEIYLFRTEGNVALSVADEQGEIVASLGTDLLHAWPATAAGVYHVALRAFEPTGYELSVVSASSIDDHANDREHATPIESGTVGTGVFEYDFDIDWLSIDLEAGASYSFDLTNVWSASLQSGINSELVQLRNDRFTGYSSDNATWYLRLEGGSSTGAYSVWTSRYQDDHANQPVGAAPILEGLPRSGAVTSGDDGDWFRFEATSDTAYTFSQTLLELAESTLQLYDDDGVTLIATIDALSRVTDGTPHDPHAILTWLAPRDQVVYARVTTAAPESRGRYHLAADRAFGDVDLDGQFGTADLVQVFARGEYDDGLDGNSTWADGDWNGDGEFDSQDLVIALQTRGWRG